jgi:hypothetical protein
LSGLRNSSTIDSNANYATVLHYDSDLEHVARVNASFVHRYIVPRGSIP